MTTPAPVHDKSSEVLDFDLNPIISSIEDVLKRQLTANLNGIQKKYSHYLDAYHSIKSLPFIVELTEANERLRKKLDESENLKEEVIHRKNEIESQVQELEQQLESANKMVKVLADKLTSLEPHNIFLEIASKWPTKVRSDSEVDDLLERLYRDLGIEEEESDDEEVIDEMQVCSKDIKEMLKELRECTDDIEATKPESKEDKPGPGDQVRIVKTTQDEEMEMDNSGSDNRLNRSVLPEDKEDVCKLDDGDDEGVKEEEYEEKEEENADEEVAEEVAEEVEEEEVAQEDAEEVDEEEVAEEVEEASEEVEEEEHEEGESEEEIEKEEDQGQAHTEGEIKEEVEEEDDDDDEVFEVEVEGKKYFASGTENGLIFEYIDEDTMGKQIGIFKNSQAIFN